MKKYDVAIIGAGVSGLTLAHFCVKAGFKTLVLEKDDQPGGTAATQRFGDGPDGFWTELGAHTCYNSYGNLLGVLEDCKVLDQVISREKVGYKLIENNELKSIVSKFGILGFSELAFSLPRLFTAKKEGESVKSYYSAICGKRNFKNVLSPMFGAVLCQNADNFPADSLFRKRHRRKDVIKHFTFKGGLKTAMDAVAQRSGFDVKTGEEAESASYENGKFAISTVKGDVFYSDVLAVAAPAFAAAKLLGSAFPDVSAELSKIKAAKAEAVAVVVKKEAVAMGSVAGIVAADDVFYSAVSRDVVKHDKFRGFTFHFKPGKLNEDEKLKRIADALHIKLNEIEYKAAKTNFVPSMNMDHPSLIERIDQMLKGRKLLLGGNYFAGVSLEDCASRSASEFARLKEMAS